MKINFNLQPKSPLLTEIKSPSTLEDSLKAKAIHHKFKFMVQTLKCWWTLSLTEAPAIVINGIDLVLQYNYSKGMICVC